MGKRLLLLIWLLTLTAWADPEVALVAHVEGVVKSGSEPVVRLQTLTVEQALSLAPGASVTLLFLADGHQEAITGPAELKLASNTSGAPRVDAGTAPSPPPPEAVRSGNGGILLRLLTPVVLHAPLPALSFRAAPGAAGPFSVNICGPAPAGFMFVSDATLPILWKTRVSRKGKGDEEVIVPYDGPPLLPDRLYYWEVANDDFNPPERRGLRLESNQARTRREAALAKLQGDSQEACLKRMAVLIAAYQLTDALEEAHKAARYGVSPALVEVARCLQADLGDPSRRQPWP